MMAERIRKIRKDAKLTQKQFGEKIGVSDAHISKIEANKDQPSDALLRVIAFEFGINLEWLKSGTGEIYNLTKAALKKLKDHRDPVHKNKLESEVEWNAALAVFYEKLYNALKISSPVMGDSPIVDHPELADMVNYLSYIYNEANERERIRIELKFENAFPEYKQVIARLREEVDQLPLPKLRFVSDSAKVQQAKSEDEQAATNQDISSDREISSSLVKEDEIIYLPVLGNTAAGKPVQINELLQGYIPVRKRIARNNAFIVKVVGDSMIDAGINDGDLAVIRPQAQVENGEIALVNIEGDSTIKYFHYENTGIRLEPANSAYKPLVYKASDNISIIGKVVQVIKKQDAVNRIECFV